METNDVEAATGPMPLNELCEKVKEAPKDAAAWRERMRAFMVAEHAKDMEYLRAKRARIADELRGKAADFFAMKSTGLGILVPVFGEQEIEEALAA